MSKNLKRRDNKGRVLQKGESQISTGINKGRFVFKYKDLNGEYKYVYSWTLTPTDIPPKGKKNDLCLREKEKAILRDLDSGIKSTNMTVYDLVKKYTESKTGLKPNTQANYKYTLNKLETFGTLPIDKVKEYDAIAYFLRLSKDGLSYNTINNMRNVIKPAFSMAVRNDMLRKNPFDFSLSNNIRKDKKDTPALTDAQLQAYLDFIKNDNHFNRYYDAIYILFNTGLRISEYSALTISDIDFEKGLIHVNKQLQYNAENGYYISTTKTRTGVRDVPMTKEVVKAFKRIITKRNNMNIANEFCIANVSGFLFLTTNNMPMQKTSWNKIFYNIMLKYNKSEPTVILPNITPHVARHTFCSNMAKRGMNPKTLQYIMGHANITITLEVYTHVNDDDIQAEFNRICIA